MKRNFNEWLGGFRESIADYGYYIDFPKIYKNVDAIKIELNILNTLVGSQNEYRARVRQSYREISRNIKMYSYLASDSF